MIARQHGLRSTEDLKDNKDNKGRIRSPLLHIKLDHIVPDELHLLLRIIDVLIRNLILAAVAEDHPAKTLTGYMDKALITAIKSCGVHFMVFGKAQYKLTYLNGNDKKV